MATPVRKPATFEDLLAQEARDRLEIIAGELVEKASPSPSHARAERKLAAAIDPFDRLPGPKGPGGWWLFTEIHTAYPSGELYCHDAAGWRRDRVAQQPTEWPVRIRPDWVCEIMSVKHEKQDVIDKPRVLHTAEVPHYWLLDPEARLLLVHRWSGAGYIVVQRAAAGETLRAEPFDAIEIRIGSLFGDDDE
ncbi:MAG TPA: Uma2 family endonuclease [Kofleriaceae bacterium]|jgi:Uma2 family endonuclease